MFVKLTYICENRMEVMWHLKLKLAYHIFIWQSRTSFFDLGGFLFTLWKKSLGWWHWVSNQILCLGFILLLWDSVTCRKHYFNIPVDLIANLSECMALYKYIRTHSKILILPLRKMSAWMVYVIKISFREYFWVVCSVQK